MEDNTITLRDIYRARHAIAPLVRRTPLVQSSALSQHIGASVYLKLETVHDMGAFKIRGATYRLQNLTEEERRRGVIAISTGNHGRGVAYAAKRMGIRAVVCMSKIVSEDKVREIRGLGAEVRILGNNFDDTRAEAERLVAKEGFVMVEPFDDPYVIAGQGTIGLEILEDLPEVDTVLVPVGGGGLISGIAIALKSAESIIRVIGVSMERGATMYESQKAGKPVEVEELQTLADNLGGGIGLNNRYTFKLVQKYVDDIITVSEEQIVAAMKYAYEKERLVTEGAAAVGIAVLLNNLVDDIGRRVVIIISARNVNIEVFLRIISGNKS